MIYFIYHLDYCVDLVKETKEFDFSSDPSVKMNHDGNMVMHAKVFEVATKYQMPALRSLAASKFKTAVQANWKHVTFAEAIQMVYSSMLENTQELKEVIADVMTAHGELLDKPEIKTVVLGINGLAYELLRKMRKSKELPVATTTDETICICSRPMVSLFGSPHKFCTSCVFGGRVRG